MVIDMQIGVLIGVVGTLLAVAAVRRRPPPPAEPPRPRCDDWTCLDDASHDHRWAQW